MKITYIKIFVMSVVNIIVFSNIFSKQFKKKVITKRLKAAICSLYCFSAFSHCIQFVPYISIGIAV